MPPRDRRRSRRKKNNNLTTNAPRVPEGRRTLLKLEERMSGPLPHPQILAQYNDAVPDAAERILAMAERQSDHRMALERRVLSGETWRSYLGLGAGFVIALAALGLAALLIDRGHVLGGVVLGIGDIATLVGVFVYGSVTRRRERQDQLRAMGAKI